LLFHALRREEVKDFRHARKGVPHLKVSGKGGKTRYLPLHPGTNGLIKELSRRRRARPRRDQRATAFTITAAPGQRTARRSRWLTDATACEGGLSR
jgi:hypothetical protein